TEVIESPATTSPSSPAATPDHSEGDLLAYEENHGINIEEDFSLPHDYDSGEDHNRAVSFPEEAELFDEEISFDETQHEYHEGDDYEGVDLYVDHDQDAEGRFDSIEDAESVYSGSNYSESSGDEISEREEELRGYCNRAIDFTLHTIIEESCEESDYERKTKEEEAAQADPSELEKYFYFGLGNGPADPKRYANEESEYSDTFSESSSSIFSEGVDGDGKYDEDIDPAELASSRLEKYFLTGLIGFERQPSIRSVGEDSELHTDESGSVGSDSEGSPSPEQPRKKLVRRPRGFRLGVANRGLVTSERGDGAPSDGSHHSEGDEVDRTLVSGEDEGSTESEETAFDKGDGQFDTIKRRKKKKSSSDYSDKRSDSDKSELKGLEHHDLEHKEDICELKNVDTLKSIAQEQEKFSKRVTIDCEKDKSDEKIEKVGDLADRKYQSRDSGFIGSSDDLLKDKPEDSSKEQKSRLSSESSVEEGENCKRTEDSKDINKSDEVKSDSFDNDSNNNKSENEDRSSGEGKVSRSSTGSSVDLPPFSPNRNRNKICRKDSFNNWSSDEETNIMMNKMRAFFKTMISNSREAPKGQKVKPPQLVAFETKLTNLMKTVPGINNEQVKEMMEYFSSEDTRSDSYDSSDYTSSDLEGACAFLDQAAPDMKSDLAEQISASCQQIIQKFDQSREPSDTDSAHSLFGGHACSESSEDASSSSKDTVFVYQKFMSSISRMKPDSDRCSIGSGSQGTSPKFIAEVLHHIGDRLVALMHEVSGGSENGDEDSLSGGHPVTSSPKVPLFIPRKHKSPDSISLVSSGEKSSLASTSFESENSPTDTEQSPESDPGTPKARKRQDPLSIVSERSSAEDFTSLESQRTVFASHDSPRHQTRLDATLPQQTTASQRSLEERGVTNIQYFVTEGSNNEVEVWQSVTIDEDKFDAREHHGVPRAGRSARRQEARKAKSHMSLEKIHQEDVKNTGERSESLGDLLDRVRSSEFSSSYEQLDSDSTLKASDSLDRHIGSSSSNIRLNASSRGSLTTSSRGSLAASSRGSLNAGSRGSLQGSSGPEEEDDKKPKKLSFFRYARRSSMPDTSKDRMSPEVRSTTLPRSNPTQVASTASLPRSQSALLNKTMPCVTSTLTSYSSPPSTLDRLTGGTSVTGPRSARYHAPGYRPPPPVVTHKKTISGLPASLRKDVKSSWAPQ
ncbi:Sytl5p, partial [Halocaridina rubra]